MPHNATHGYSSEEIDDMINEVAEEEPPFIDRLSNFILNQGGAQGLAGLGLLTGAYGALGGIGERGLNLGRSLAEQQMAQSSFRPYTVTSATGGEFGTTVTPYTRTYTDPVTGETRSITEERLSTTMTLSPEEQAFQRSMFTGAGDFFTKAAADPSVREEQILGQIEDALAPEQRAQRLGLEERLAAQGRLGVRTAAFGGTPEQLAMEKAQAQQLAQARLGAAQQARQEQMGLAQLGQQYLGAGYIPQAQLLGALTPGQTAAGQAQQAQLYGTGLFGEATASGIDALLGSALGQANLMGAAGTGLLSGLYASPQAGGSGGDGFLSGLVDLFGFGG
jgi:hypothetical protein